jgi:hypothetical protein
LRELQTPVESIERDLVDWDFEDGISRIGFPGWDFQDGIRPLILEIMRFKKINTPTLLWKSPAVDRYSR